MKEEIKGRYKRIKELFEEVNLEQYSEPKTLDGFDEAVKLLSFLRPLIIDIRAFQKMLREEIKSKSDKKTEPSGIKGLIKYRQSLLNFDAAKKSVIVQIEKLSKSIVDNFPDEAKAADEVVEKIKYLNENLQDLIDSAMNQLEDESRPINSKILHEIKEYQEFLKSNPLVAHLDKNPFDSSVKIRETLWSALVKIEAAMPAVA